MSDLMDLMPTLMNIQETITCQRFRLDALETRAKRDAVELQDLELKVYGLETRIAKLQVD